ncbi:MAG: ABC transporter permease [Sphingomonadales bacterium]
MDEDFDALYGAEEERLKIFAAFALLAVLVACLGLFGLASFAADRRTKEIGLRKVMGATVPAIVKLLLWQFSKPVLLANIIAWPVAYYFINGWLENFKYRIELLDHAYLFVAAGAIALIVAWLTVGLHATRVARSNPINALRCE